MIRTFSLTHGPSDTAQQIELQTTADASVTKTSKLKKNLLIITGVLLAISQILVIFLAPLQPVVATILCLVIISVGLGLFLQEYYQHLFHQKSSQQEQLRAFDQTLSQIKDSLASSLQKKNEELKQMQQKLQEQDVMLLEQSKTLASQEAAILALQQKINGDDSKDSGGDGSSQEKISSPTRNSSFRNVIKAFKNSGKAQSANNKETTF